MSEAAEFDSATAFEIAAPRRQTIPVIFNSPHSGRRYPASFLAASRLDAWTIRRSEDTFVDELFLPVVDLGAPLLRAHFPRAWLDVNREPYELDPRLFTGTLPPYANARSPRVAGGLGTIPRIVAENEEIYDAPMPVAEGLARIESAYLPYHAALAGLISQTRTAFGCAVLVDCHSMPSSVRSPNLRGRPDFVLGDRHGASCGAEVTSAAEMVLTRLGYDVCRNRPYAGGHITEFYGRPGAGVHAIQVEVNRGLYLNERTLQKTANFPRLAADLLLLAQAIARASEEAFLPRAEAAE
jgi:N-formylglutamate amidohydrolase